MSKQKSDKLALAYFGKKFSEKFNTGKKTGKWKDQEDFSQKLTPRVTRVTVNKWKNGKAFPQQFYMNQLCDLFGVNDDYFDIKNATLSDLYELSSDYMDHIGNDVLLSFCDEIGLNQKFLIFIKEVIGEDFGPIFPTWTPIEANKDSFSLHLGNGKPYIRRSREVWSECAEMSTKINYLQYEIEFEEDGIVKKKLIPFSIPDLRFLKDVQNYVMDDIERIMMHRSNDIKREVEEACNKSTRKLKGSNSPVYIQLKAEDLNLIDRYCKEYTDEIEGEIDG